VESVVPALVVVFNRPDVTRMLVDNLRTVAPRRLFVAADGPRDNHADDAGRCHQVRRELERIDWECDVSFLAHDHNLGLQRAMVTAIDWFFGEVEAGIVLEDDCVVHPDFFDLAAAVLERYADVREVMYLTATNMRPDRTFGDGASWHFASAGHIWGWATWRRAWEGYDSQLSDWPSYQHEFGPGQGALRRALGAKADAAHRGSKHTWARAWHYHVAKQRGLVAVPATNLVRNVGVGPDATHTVSRRHSLIGLPVDSITRPFVAPTRTEPDPGYDAVLTSYHRWGWRRRTRELARRTFNRPGGTRHPR